MDKPAIFQFASFVIGLLFGSFLNVCISRLPRHESVVRPRSRCPECGAPIRWYDNIPLLSWIVIRGRCRDCKRPIPARYPLVELAMGVWFLLCGSRLYSICHIYRHTAGIENSYLGNGIAGVLAFAILGFLLVGLLVMDWQTNLLPNAFTLWGIVIGFLLICVRAVFLGPTQDEVMLSPHHVQLTSVGSVVDTGNVFLTGPEHLLLGRITAICGAALVLLAIRQLYKVLRHREGMGLGDVKLLAMIAAFLGFWPAILSLFLGSLLASIYGVFLLVRGKASATSRLAFGSFLAAGGMIAALYGSRLIEMYATQFR